MWEGANANMSGVVLVPLAGVLSPPLLELASMVAFLVASPVLLVLLLSRSPRFPRHYLVSVIMLSALVMASVRGAAAAMIAAEAVQEIIETSGSSAAESAQLTEGLARYTSVVGSTAVVLVWALAGCVIWIPAIFSSKRVRTTFAKVAGDHSPKGIAMDVKAITTRPWFPG